MEEVKIEEWMRTIPQLTSSQHRMKIYAYLYYIQQNTNDVYVSIYKIEEVTGIAAPNVSVQIKKLIKAGLLVITKPAVLSKNPLLRRSAHYKVIIPEYVEVIKMREKMDDVLEYNKKANNQELINFIKANDKIPNDTQELLLNWLSDPLKDGSYINDTLGRFRLKMNELIKFCSYDGVVNWEKFNSHVERAYKCAGVKLIYDGDKSEVESRKSKVIGL